MTSRQIDFQVRKDRVLAVTISQYINTVSPVSSNSIVKEYMPGFSSATIRNILAELEHEGFLTHPHTSAGRIPTQQGYRYYVDHLMEEIQLLEEEKRHIKAEYELETLKLEALLDKTSKVLSDVTHYTSIVSVDGWDHTLFCGGISFIPGYSDYSDLDRDIKKIKNILAALDGKEMLLEVINRNLAKRIDVLIGQEMECSDIDGCSLVVSQYKFSKRGTSGRIAVLGPTRMDYNRVVSALDYFSGLMEEML